MPKMTAEEAFKIMKNSPIWLRNYNGDHAEAVGTVVQYVHRLEELGRESSAIMGFAVGRAYGIREERERRRRASR